MRAKKFLILIVLSFFIVGIAGCGLTAKGKSGSALENGKQSIAEKNYEKAVEDLKAAVEADENNEPAKVLLEMLEDYLEAKSFYEKSSLDESLKALNGIDSRYKDYAIAKDIDGLKKSIAEELERNKAIDEKIAAIKTALDEKRYDEAQTYITETSDMLLDESRKSTLSGFQSRLDGEKAAKTAEEAAKAAKTAEEAAKAAKAAEEAAKAAEEATKSQQQNNQAVEEPYYGPSDVYDPYYDEYYDPYYDPYYDEYYDPYYDPYYDEYYGPSDVYDPYYDEYYGPSDVYDPYYDEYYE